MYLYTLLLIFVGWRVSWTETIVRKDAYCAVQGNGGKPRLPQCDWHYIAYFPRIFRSGVTENVVFSTRGFSNDVVVSVELLDKSGDVKITEVSQEAKPGQLISVPLHVPHDAPSTVKVLLKGIGKTDEGDMWRFSNISRDIQVERLGLTILIQTDRPIYKPGQLIRSRVIVVDSRLKPFNGILESVSIVNPSDSIMRIWRDTKLVDGFASFDLQTSVKPVLGKWKIKVATQSYKKALTITVQKYVLPKFQVIMTPPPFLSKMDGKIIAVVCAKYSYGKPVIGKMNATICLKRRHTYYSRLYLKDEKPNCHTVYKKIDGCTDIDADLKKMEGLFKDMKAKKRHYYYSNPSVYATFRATVKEKATGVSMSSSEIQKNILGKIVQLSIESKGVFKPGFPLSIKVHAKYPDGSKIERLTVNVTATCRRCSEDLLRTVELDISYGVKEIKIPQIPFNAKSLYIRVTHMRGKLTPDESDWRRTSSADKTVQPWYSPTHSYLNMHKVEDPVKIGSDVTITVGYTSVYREPIERDITYSMMCAGNLVKSGMFQRTFIAASPYMTTTPAPTTSTTSTTSTTTTTTIPTNYTIPFTPPPFIQRVLPPIWWGSTATRPPKPYHFSTGEFKFTVGIDKKMLPSCSMVVYYVNGEEVVADQTDIDVINEFENQISMEFDKTEVKPGSSVKLTVKGAANSRIAVAAVDQSIHFLAKGNDIKDTDLLNIRKKLTIPPGYVGRYGTRCGPSWYYEKRDFVDSETAFSNVGAIFLSSLRADVRPCKTQRYVYHHIGFAVGMRGSVKIPYIPDGLPSPVSKGGPKEGPKAKSGKAAKKTRARTEFPETWLWTDERLSENGERVFDVKVPDSITTWYASGFGLSQTAGLGVANPALLRAFQPFFISLTLPYSVVRDEDVTIPAAVFSYLEKSCMTVKVSLQFSAEYKMIAGPNAKTCLCSGRTATVLFRIRPKKLGHIKIRIRAETLENNLCASSQSVLGNVQAADILEKRLLVEPEGIKEEYTKSTYFCPNTSPEKKFTTEMELKVPDSLVPGSIFAKVTAMGDIMGSSLSNIDSLLAMPYGCGEQNMLKFAPNIFIMNYLNNTNQVTSEIERKALDYMRTGYQRELTYKHDDGAYSAFGKRDKEGSTWLSAFVLKSYAQARPWIDVDEKEIKQTYTWLLNSQAPDGCFPTIGKLHNKAMKGGVKTNATLTAYVLISLLEAGYNPQLKRLDECVTTAFKQFSDAPEEADSYSLSIMAYLFAKLKNPLYVDAMKYLDDKAIQEDGMVHWEEEEKGEKTPPVSIYYKARSTDIEQTAYVLLAKLENDAENVIESTIPIVRWLSKQRNSLGGWSSTQDTVLAMQALAEFAERTYSGEADMEVSVTADGFDHTFSINRGNKLVLQRVEEVPVPSTLHIFGEGEGCALIQTSVKYNVREVKVKPTFSVDYTIRSLDDPLSIRKSCRSQILEVCVSWLGEEESNMAIVDVQMISGFEADQGTFDQIRHSTANLKEIEVKEKSVMFYFSRIGKLPQCVTFRVEQITNVRKTKPAPIKVYDYYDTGKSATVMYTFTKEHCIGSNNVVLVPKPLR